MKKINSKYCFQLVFITIFTFIISSCEKNSQDQQKPVTTAQKQVADAKKEEKKIPIDPNIMIPLERITITHKAELMTSKGKIVLGLYGKDAPKAVENFIGLAKKGYYNGIKFHRIAKNFLIQAGDRLTRNSRRMEDWGTGGESIYKKEFEDELNTETPSYKIGYIKGTLAMANRGQNTNKSQFFICLEEAEKLEHNWTIFGRVLEGMDIVELISTQRVIPSSRGADDGIPRKPIIIHWVKLKK
jgi:peptidylprolyl isomerase